MTPARWLLPWSLACAVGVGAADASAQRPPHIHGTVHLQVEIGAAGLQAELFAPLEALLGFEHRPRTTEEIEAADALRTALLNPPTLLAPNPAAGCRMTTVLMDDRPLEPVAASGGTAKGPAHADLAWKYVFECRSTDQLSELELTIFDVYRRVKRVRATVTAGGTKFKRDLQRPQTALPLSR